MSTTAAIVWALVATGIGLTACALSEYQCRWKDYWANEAEDCLLMAKEALDERDEWNEHATNAERALATYKATEKARLSAHMREIGRLGNTSPKRKRVA